MSEPAWQVLDPELSRVRIARYAGAAGDFNRIHVDEPYAVSIGLPSVMAHGMLVMGLASRMLAEWCDPRDIAMFSGRFIDRTWPGDQILGAIAADDAGPSLTVEVTAGGRQAFRGQALLGNQARDAARTAIERMSFEREFTSPVERGHIRQFAKALDLSDPIYFDAAQARSRGYREVVAPLTFARSCIIFDPARDATGPRPLRVAGEHRFDYLRPICAGDLVNCRVGGGRTWTKQGRRGGILTFREEVTVLCIGDVPCVVSTALGIEPQRLTSSP